MKNWNDVAIGFILGSLFTSEDGGGFNPIENLNDPQRDFILPLMREKINEEYLRAVDSLEQSEIIKVNRKESGEIEEISLTKALEYQKMGFGKLGSSVENIKKLNNSDLNI